MRFPADYFGLAIFGREWKPAPPLMASRSLARAAHLLPMMSSSSFDHRDVLVDDGLADQRPRGFDQIRGEGGRKTNGSPFER